MPFRFSIKSIHFHFRFEARTSRGALRQRTSWFILIHHDHHPDRVGIGECAPLAGLSPEPIDQMDTLLPGILQPLQKCAEPVPGDVDRLIPPEYPAMRMALETALLDFYHGGRRLVFDNSFIRGMPIPINGLIWMGDPDFMLQQIIEKVDQGYSCLKLKVGALDFEEECRLLAFIREKYKNLEIRLDANGAFPAQEALHMLRELARFKIHSIEQPISPGHPALEDICRNSPVPVALDEELIGISGEHDRQQLLRRARPAYIILKPTLHGAFSGCAQWIQVAESQGVGWWVTSALESNIGLNAICQFTAQYPAHRVHGLGTGQLYENNFSSPLTAERGVIRYEVSRAWDLRSLFS